MNESELQIYLKIVAKQGESKADYAYTPDDEPSHWRLNISDATHVGGALAALNPSGGGFRGQHVAIPSDALAGVKRKVLAAWRKFHPDAKPEDEPNFLKKGVQPMTVEEMGVKLTDLETQLTETTKRADRADAIVKLTTKERAAFEKLDDPKKDEFLKADANGRKAFMKQDDDEGEGEGEGEGEEEQPDQMAELEKSLRAEFAKQLSDQKKESDERIAKAEAIAQHEREIREKAEFNKRADSELGNYSGTSEEKGALLRALANGVSKTLTKEEVEGIQSLLKVGNDAIGKSMQPIGKDYVPVTGSAEKQVDALVAKRIADTKESYATAYSNVIKAHPDLYEQMDKERMKQ